MKVFLNLQQLVHDDLLESTDERGAIYHLPGAPLPRAEDVFGGSSVDVIASSSHSGLSSLHSSSHSGSSSSHSGPSSLHSSRDAQGCLHHELLAVPIIDDITVLAPQLRVSLEQRAGKHVKTSRLGKLELETLILSLCSDHYVTSQALGVLLNRSSVSLRNRYLTPLVRERKLLLSFPTTPTHEKQAYRTADPS
jgi:ATP-dependent DNA helicase RecG